MSKITPPKIYIDLTDISRFLPSEWAKQFKLDTHSMQIIEEVVFLCGNEEFIKDINYLRKCLLKKQPKLPLPTSNKYIGKKVLESIYRVNYKVYKKLVNEIIHKFKLIPQIYWKDLLRNLDRKISEEINDAECYDEKITKTTAKSRVLENMFDDFDLELLDNIIILNKPFDISDSFPYWANPFITRKSNSLKGVSLNLNLAHGPYLEIGFSPYATLKEMQDTLKKHYPEIQRYREKTLPLSRKRDHRKDNLPKMVDAYMLYIQGKDEILIANYLDSKYGGNISFEGVNQLISRYINETKKFDKNK